jgi:CheY-like chemotaxis protein
MLQSLGYSVLTARDGVDAVEVFQRHGGEIDLVLLDVVMPRMGAVECLAALMALDPSVRAVVSTGYVRSYSLTKLLDSDGVVGFIPKPFQLSRLSRVVSEALAIARGVPPLISADEGIPPSDVH